MHIKLVQLKRGYFKYTLKHIKPYICTNAPVHTKEHYFLSPKEKKRLRSLSRLLPLVFTGYLSLLSIYLVLSFSLSAIGNIVIIKAKEYL